MVHQPARSRAIDSIQHSQRLTATSHRDRIMRDVHIPLRIQDKDGNPTRIWVAEIMALHSRTCGAVFGSAV